MQNIYLQSNEHFQVFTTVFSPQVNRGKRRHSHQEHKVAVAHSFVPQCPDDVEHARIKVTHVPNEDESRWFGQLQKGQQDYFPSSAFKLSHCTHSGDDSSKKGSGLRRHSSVHVGSVVILGEHVGGGKQQAPKGTGGVEGPFLTLKQDTQAPSSTNSSPGLLHRLLSKQRRRSQSQGANNGAFEPE